MSNDVPVDVPEPIPPVLDPSLAAISVQISSTDHLLLRHTVSGQALALLNPDTVRRMVFIDGLLSGRDATARAQFMTLDEEEVGGLMYLGARPNLLSIMAQKLENAKTEDEVRAAQAMEGEIDRLVEDWAALHVDENGKRPNFYAYWKGFAGIETKHPVHDDMHGSLAMEWMNDISVSVFIQEGHFSEKFLAYLMSPSARLIDFKRVDSFLGPSYYGDSEGNETLEDSFAQLVLEKIDQILGDPASEDLLIYFFTQAPSFQRRSVSQGTRDKFRDKLAQFVENKHLYSHWKDEDVARLAVTI